MESVITDAESAEITSLLRRWTDSTITAMWRSNPPMVFSKRHTHAALEVSNDGVRIVANPKFWKKLSPIDKSYIICHELLHLAFGHWVIDMNEDPEWANIAKDIQVNEHIFIYFPVLFCNADVDKATIDTVFRKKSNLVSRVEDYKYYYGLLMKCVKKRKSKRV